MNFARVEEIANAVLYEGYMLYPYRPSAVKNQQRWNFGVLCPLAYCEMHPGSESSWMQTQCLLRSTQESRLTVRVRFLQIIERQIARDPGRVCLSGIGATGQLEVVDRLEIGGRVYHPWQETTERTVTCEELKTASLRNHTMDFTFPAGSSREDLCDSNGVLAGALLREWQSVQGSLHIAAEAGENGAVKLSVRVENRTAFRPRNANQAIPRDAVMPYALVSAHMVLGVEDGEFLSSLDPPADYLHAAAHCENVGTWPVLAGDDATTVLASPIILYDYPQIAPESAGNLFDGTEIDEILSLRILTLTDQEKGEIRQSDDRAGEVLDRTESIPEEQFLKLHGVLRGVTTLKEGT